MSNILDSEFGEWHNEPWWC